ncbi:phosphoglycolate phosphatase [Sulfolobus tengchongensis]|uniref:Phosphoglycolate phosphatase n=2 Tax=Sulfolobus tengchongensis TaxID=207809 RepID=A0AAX4L3J7_9CREN
MGMSSVDILVASDYDRTLANEENNFVISPSVVQKVNEFSKKYKFIVVTGREKRFIDKLAIGLKPTAWILENGTLILYNNKEFVLCDDNWFEKDRKKIIEILNQLEIKYSLGRVIIYLDGFGTKLDAIREIEKYGKIEVNRNDAMILPKGVDKGVGVMKFKQLIGFKGKIVALGDSENDYALFRIADIKVAVANAIPQVKEMADIVTEKPNGLGVIEILDKILSGQLRKEVNID